MSLRSDRQLSRLVDQLLELARWEPAEGLTREPVAVAETGPDVVAKFALEAQGQGVNLPVDTEDQNLTVSADIARLERVFTNLIESRVYTPAGGEWSPELRRDGDAVAVEIADARHTRRQAGGAHLRPATASIMPRAASGAIAISALAWRSSSGCSRCMAATSAAS